MILGDPFYTDVTLKIQRFRKGYFDKSQIFMEELSTASDYEMLLDEKPPPQKVKKEMPVPPDIPNDRLRAGQILRREILNNYNTMGEFSRHAGMSAATVSNLVNGKTPISVWHATRICDYLGRDKEYWLYLGRKPAFGTSNIQEQSIVATNRENDASDPNQVIKVTIEGVDFEFPPDTDLVSLGEKVLHLKLVLSKAIS